jgi:sialate O-acetylesterase
LWARRWLVAAVACAASPFMASAEVRLPRALGSDMVLQRDVPARIWGSADPGEDVAVRFAGQERQARADERGRWAVTLDPMPASDQGRELVVEGRNLVRLTGVLVGDVWVCSGQSNMEYPVRRPEQYRGPPTGMPDRAAEALAAGKHEGIRLLKIQKVLSPGDVTTDGWMPAEGEALAKFSAAAFFFAKHVHRETGVPIGLIDVSWGGTRIEVWTDAGVYDRYPEIGAPTTRPLFVDGHPVGRQYDRMVRPLTPMRVKGFLWYQGESNLLTGETARYALKFRALIESWRLAFEAADAPFYFVQLAPYAYANRKQEPRIRPEALAEFREAQAAVLSLPRTGMVATTDLVDNLGDIHPWNKWDVGHRLALFALARDYGKAELDPESPRMTGVAADGGGAVVTFAHAGEGLGTSDGKPPAQFTVAGADGRFVPAKAEILPGGEIRVSAEGVSEVREVRYAWHERAKTNLQNPLGLPALPFSATVSR